MIREIAISLTRAWTWTYTLGVEPAIKQARREEIDSDLCEHFSYAGLSGEVASTTAVAVLGRVVRGLPADLFWRFDLEGEPKMVSKSVLVRGGGVILLGIVASFIGMMAFEYGIGSDEPYFTDDFPIFAENADSRRFAIVFSGIFSFVALLGAGVLFQTFRGYQPWLAGLGSGGLALAGVCMVASTTAGVVLVDLAKEWVAAGSVQGDGFWISARHVAGVYENLAFISVGFLIIGLAAFSALTLWKGLLPRWLGAIGATSGVMGVVAMVSDPIIGDTSWLFIMLGAGLGLLWLAIAGAWLLFKGTYVGLQPVASAP